MDVQAGDSIKDRLAGVFDRTRSAMLEAGRDEGTVRLVAASKGVSIDRIREAINAGVQIAGENRLQEALPKVEALKGERITWHFIGQLQRRKVRAVVGIFELIGVLQTPECGRGFCSRSTSGQNRAKQGFWPTRWNRRFPSWRR